MTVVNQSVTGLKNDRKTTSLKAFEYSPPSVVLRRRKVKMNMNMNVKVKGDVFGRCVRNQIERIRAEDSHLGEDIGECLIVKICGAGNDQDVIIFSRAASPLSGKGEGRMNVAC